MNTKIQLNQHTSQNDSEQKKGTAADHHEIGATTYIVTSSYKESGKEILFDKLLRLMKKDIDNIKY